MDTTAITILSLLIAYGILTIIRDSFKKKWYKEGYTDASINNNLNRSKPLTYSEISKEASKSFDDKHGFQYD